MVFIAFKNSISACKLPHPLLKLSIERDNTWLHEPVRVFKALDNRFNPKIFDSFIRLRVYHLCTSSSTPSQTIKHAMNVPSMDISSITDKFTCPSIVTDCYSLQNNFLSNRNCYLKSIRPHNQIHIWMDISIRHLKMSVFFLF